NAYLSPDERRAALSLSRGLAAAEAKFRSGERNAAPLVATAREVLVTEPKVRIDYVDLLTADELAETATPPASGDAAGVTIDRPVVLAIAAFVGTTRLIDNRVLSP